MFRVSKRIMVLATRHPVSTANGLWWVCRFAQLRVETVWLVFGSDGLCVTQVRNACA